LALTALALAALALVVFGAYDSYPKFSGLQDSGMERYLPHPPPPKLAPKFIFTALKRASNLEQKTLFSI